MRDRAVAPPRGRQIWVSPGFFAGEWSSRVWRVIRVQTRALLTRI